MKKKQKKTGGEASYQSLLDELRHYLPSQGPIKDFIHHNTLHTFQEMDLTFHEAIRKSSSLYGANEYLGIEEYRAAYKAGRISDEALDYILENEKESAKTDMSELRNDLLHARISQMVKHRGFRNQGHLSNIAEDCNVNIEEEIHPVIFRLLANYLDQGIAAITLSEDSANFWQTLVSQFQVARPAGISKEVAQLIIGSEPEVLLQKLIPQILRSGSEVRTFLLEILMTAPGWAGFVSQVEEQPEHLIYPREIKLIDYVALYVAILYVRVKSMRAKMSSLLSRSLNDVFFTEKYPPEGQDEKILRLWHEAFEMTYYREALSALAYNAHARRGRSSRAKNATMQTVFCIDDRECSLRRHLEEVSDRIETFGTPGFFAIDAVYQGPYDAISIKQCPAPVTPRFKIRGIATQKRKIHFSRMEMNFWHRHANHLYSGWIISQIFGIVSLLRLIFSVHFPKKTFATASSVSMIEDMVELKYERSPLGHAHGGYYEGYSVPEMAERVLKVLKQIGLTKDFGSIVAIIGHGASSTNNPYFAAYDCGACSGRSGLMNARAFALMANRKDVRALLKKSGLNIPVSTYFVGAVHDTTRDEIEFLDIEKLPSESQDKVRGLKDVFEKALARNAFERTRRFELVALQDNFKNSLLEVRHRSEMLFEPRPEYNHATNALAVVGRRSLTENLFLDRRAFFNSYDPAADRDGEILNGILTPLVPVCGGINLEYLFSRLDNEKYGAGSKLPHNVFSLFGVANGAEGDLRTGLPQQMIEIHDPVRLLIVVEQSKLIVEKVIKKNAAVHDWIKNEWVKFCIYDYVKKQFFFYRAGKFESIDISSNRVPEIADSLEIIQTTRNDIQPSAILRGREV